MELDTAIGAAKTSSSTRNQFCIYYNTNETDDTDNGSEISSIDAMTVNSELIKELYRSIEDKNDDAIASIVSSTHPGNNGCDEESVVRFSSYGSSITGETDLTKPLMKKSRILNVSRAFRIFPQRTSNSRYQQWFELSTLSLSDGSSLCQ